MKTFKELTIGDVIYIYTIDRTFPFCITKIEKYSGLLFYGMFDHTPLVSSWMIPKGYVNLSLTSDCAITFELAKQHQSKLVYKRNIVRRYANKNF